MKKWEYWRQWTPVEPLNEVWFNEHGRLGWEICGIWPAQEDNIHGIFVVFKRELTDDQGTRKADA